jgi:hypothetical protein
MLRISARVVCLLSVLAGLCRSECAPGFQWVTGEGFTVVALEHSNSSIPVLNFLGRTTPGVNARDIAAKKREGNAGPLYQSRWRKLRVAWDGGRRFVEVDLCPPDVQDASCSTSQMVFSNRVLKTSIQAFDLRTSEPELASWIGDSNGRATFCTASTYDSADPSKSNRPGETSWGLVPRGSPWDQYRTCGCSDTYALRRSRGAFYGGHGPCSSSRSMHSSTTSSQCRCQAGGWGGVLQEGAPKSDSTGGLHGSHANESVGGEQYYRMAVSLSVDGQCKICPKDKDVAATQKGVATRSKP